MLVILKCLLQLFAFSQTVVFLKSQTVTVPFLNAKDLFDYVGLKLQKNLDIHITLLIESQASNVLVSSFNWMFNFFPQAALFFPLLGMDIGHYSLSEFTG